MLKILWNRGEIAPEEQFLLLFTIFSYLMLDFYVKTRIGFSLRDKRLFEITEVEITRVDCMSYFIICLFLCSLMGKDIQIQNSRGQGYFVSLAKDHMSVVWHHFPGASSLAPLS